jgi:hypothetical protein
MRKLIVTLILCFTLVFDFSLPVFAANHVNIIDIKAVIHEDGSIRIIQNWEGTFEEGTES